MSTPEDNPYKTPGTQDFDRSFRVHWFPLFLQAGANLLALIAVVVSQFVIRGRFAVAQMALPSATSLALGSSIPVALIILLVLTIASHVITPDGYRTRLEAIFVILLGSIIGFYVIACCLPFATGPQRLSLRSDLLNRSVNVYTQLVADNLMDAHWT